VDTLLRLSLRYPRWSLALCGLVTLVMSAGILRLRQDTSPEAFLPRGHVSYEDKKYIDRTFGIRDSIVISLVDRIRPDIFNPDALAAIRDVSAFVASVPGVRSASVKSLSTWDDIRGTEEGMDIRGFLDEIPSDKAGLDRLRERVGSFDVYRGLLVSADGKAAYVVADVEEDADMIAVFDRVQAYSRSQIDPRQFLVSLTGPPVITGTFNRYLNLDALRLDPISGLVTAAVLWVLFRTAFAVLLPFVIVLPAVAWALGAMGYWGANFTPFSNAIPVVILCIAMSDAVHILGAYYEHCLRRPNVDLRVGLEELLLRLWRPVGWTSLTNAAGFAALKFGSPMVPVQEFGIAVAIGAVAEAILSFFALPQLLLLLRPKVPAHVARKTLSADGGRLDRGMGWLAEVLQRRPAAVLAPLLLLMVVSGVGISRIQADYNLAEFFPRDSDVWRDHVEITKRFAGTGFVDLSVDSGRPDGVFEPPFLETLDALGRDIESRPGVGKVLGLPPYIKKLHQAVNQDAASAYRIGSSAEVNAQLLLLFASTGDPAQIDELVDAEQRQAHLRVFLKEPRFSANRETLDWLEGRMADSFPAGTYRIGGESYVNHHWMRGIGANVLESVAMMLASMFVVGLLVLRDPRYALMMIVPVSMAIAVTYGLMGLLGVTLGLATSIFASIALGMGVDYATHFLFHYRLARTTLDPVAATAFVVRTTGKIIVGNAVTVASGFLVLLAAKTVPPAQIGVFTAAGVAVSLVTTLLALGVAARFLPAPAETFETGEHDAAASSPAVG
jgi:uncharacterized protein